MDVTWMFNRNKNQPQLASQNWSLSKVFTLESFEPMKWEFHFVITFVKSSCGRYERKWEQRKHLGDGVLKIQWKRVLMSLQRNLRETRMHINWWRTNAFPIKFVFDVVVCGAPLILMQLSHQQNNRSIDGERRISSYIFIFAFLFLMRR